MGSVQDCWLEVLKREISLKIPDTSSPGQIAEVSTGFLVVMHLHVFLPVFLLLTMYGGFFISLYSQSKFTFPPS